MQMTPNNKEKISHMLLRLFLFIALCLFLIIFAFMSRKKAVEEMREGQVALKTIYAPTDFSYQGPLDSAKTKLAKQEVVKSVVEIFNRQRLVLANEVFEKLPQDIQADESKKKLLESIYDNIFKNNYFTTPEEKKRLLDNNAQIIDVFDPADGISKEIAVSSIKTLAEAREEFNKTIAKEPFSKKDRGIILDVISASIRPNVILDTEKTLKLKSDVENAVAPVYRQINIKKDELIINKGQVVTKIHLKKLQSLYAAQPKTDSLFLYGGISILLVLLIIIAGVFLKVYFPKVYFSNRQLFLLSLLLVLAVFSVKAVEVSPYSIFLAPVASIPMAYFMLTGNPAVSFLLASTLSIILGITFSNDLGLPAVFFIGSIIGIIAVSQVRRRSHILQAGILVAIVQFISILGWGLGNNLDYSVALTQSWLGIGNGILCIAVLMVCLPILEALFSLATNITLLELSDFNQPLLKYMVLKAPGTYHHSLLVGNLSEAAAESIGANSLLARVGAYFHDIGKIEKSEYFSENQMDRENKHDILNPSMSKMVIMNHVKEGLELARKYKLRKPIVDFITQHHGTSLVYYFYRRALEGQVEADEVKEDVFRYPGPKPQSKETAICLLADSAEAAIRSIDDPTPSKVEDAVHKIINNKFIDGQLDECDLKLKDLETIASVFTRILTGVYHSRVPYPEKKNGSIHKEQPNSSNDIKRNGKEDSKKDSL